MPQSPLQSMPPHAIAVVGMVGRFPGAGDVASLWANVLAGREGITFFADEELDASIAPALRSDPAYVKAKGVMADCDRFDADFFGVTPLEARVMDPQHRVLLELAWSALETSGHRPSDFGGRIGVYVGANWNRYRLNNVGTNPEVIASFGELKTALANEQDFLATRISYKLNLKGPSYTVNTACSTSLVAIAQAAQALSSGDCDLALAGGASISVPVKAGYLSEIGGMLSGDGHCRPFDEDCSGTTFNDGAGVVVLRRLADAIADGDDIQAVIRGYAVNNDGADKVSFTAPSVAGQAEVLRNALEHAAVDPGTIGYVEAHGTGTPMGDPIEFAALSRAYQSTAVSASACALGSVKSSVGHLVHAAGVTGFIMAVLAVQKATIPPTLFFRTPNARLRIEQTRFHVLSAPQEWPATAHPRRAGVSSFGVGGTNAHVVIEQAPPGAPLPGIAGLPHRHAYRIPYLLCFSAKNEAALLRQVEGMSQFLASDPAELSLPSLAWTLQQGRVPMRRRLAVVAATVADGASALSDRRQVQIGDAVRPRGVVFQFPGFGAQRPGMGRWLYEQSPVFRRCLEEGMELVRDLGGPDLRLGLLGDAAEVASEFADLRVAQPALFLFEHALAVTLESSGLVAEVLIGCSLGEFAAAVLAGVVSLEDAMRVVLASAEATGKSSAGKMMTVFCSESEIQDVVSAGVAVAAVHAQDVVVLSGTVAAVETARLHLEQRGIRWLDLSVDRPYHSPLLEPVAVELEPLLQGIQFSAPSRMLLSSVTGAELSDEEAEDPSYWARILCRPIRYADALRQLGEGVDHVLVEVGPGSDLTGLALLHPGASRSLPMAILPGGGLGPDALQQVHAAIAHCWMSGGEVDFTQLWSGPQPRRIPLPTYPFDRTRHWLEPRVHATTSPSEAPAGELAHGQSSSSKNHQLPGMVEVGGVHSPAGLRAVRGLVEQQIALLQAQLQVITLAEKKISGPDHAPKSS